MMEKGKAYADCGCEMDRMLKPSFVWDFDGEGELCVGMETICDECFITDDENGEILSRDDVREFLGNQVAIHPNMRYSGDKY